MNIVDIIIFIVLVIYMALGYYYGFIRVALELIGFFFSLAISFALYPPFAAVLSKYFSKIPLSVINLLSFFIIWVVFDAIYLIGAHFFYKKFNRKITDSKINRITGIFASLAKGVILIAVTLTLIAYLPVQGLIKSKVLNSKIASRIVAQTSVYEQDVQKLFGRAIKDSLAYFMVKPKENERIELNFKTTAVTVDASSEDEMLKLVNGERTKRGIKPLSMENSLRFLARAHSRDMLAKGYFAHINPENKDPFDRMETAGINYEYAGENLALAPTVDLAHEGLMNSEGHKANILDPNFGKVGIGCIDAGPYGKMFSQEFTE